MRGTERRFLPDQLVNGENPTSFLTLSREVIDSALSREIVAELRNEGHVEEEVRGTIRLTPRGYRALQNDPPRYYSKN